MKFPLLRSALLTIALFVTVLTVPAAATTIRVTTQPESRTVVAGRTLTFSASVSVSTLPIRVSWQSAAPSRPFSAISGSTPHLRVVALLARNGYRYRALFHVPGSTLYSSPATLTVSTNIGAQFSANWAGYVASSNSATGGPFTSASASWVVPAVTCHSSAPTSSSVWVGIDGYHSSTVEQLGTDQDCVNGAPSYSVWYEMYGDPSTNPLTSATLDPTAYPLNAGDSISASVTYAAGVWVFTISDASASWASTTPVPSPTLPPQRASAEWILERPSLCDPTCSTQSLGTVSPVTFADVAASTTPVPTIPANPSPVPAVRVPVPGVTILATALSGPAPLSSFLHAAFYMQNGPTSLTSPSPLKDSGTSFTITSAPVK